MKSLTACIFIAMAVILLQGACSPSATAGNLRFDPLLGKAGELTMPDGMVVEYIGYEGIKYLSHGDNEEWQTLNFYVPRDRSQDQSIPILLRTYVGGYMGAKAQAPSPYDATGRALKEGYAVCIPGSRGWNTEIDGQYPGTAPNGLLDLKAAVAYLHFNDNIMPGDACRIITDGTSAGGAMSALLGATGDLEEYASALEQMGAAPASNAVWASVCYCPITDLNHADIEYEWLYGCTNTGVRALDAQQIAVSDALSAECPAYINSLGLKNPTTGEEITTENYKAYLTSFLIASAQRALQEGVSIADNIGLTFHKGRDTGDYVKSFDLDAYLSYVASKTPLKTPPAFDAWGVISDRATPENKVFGNELGQPANFTDFSIKHRTGDPSAKISEEQAWRVSVMNPMVFIGRRDAATAAHWYIRHGAIDRDTSFLVPVNLYTKLANNGYDVDFALPWNRPHSGDYNLDDLFRWIESIVKQ